ncbi:MULTISPECIES: LysR family transcriptional regulator [unclassified Nocardia]|uniref:LysR family transcriptional regulator n=1 Tax=unclassified Nocardia TaxID=2637762 RepID=UPI001CE49784|nr:MULTISPECIES: LysR family transcriptional regulator [unclassified Nocardia]
MELRTLEYFVAVVEEGSFTRAAVRCRVAQSAISQQIRRLERELGESLLERGPRHVVPTSGGRALLPMARECLDAAARATSEFAARSGLLRGELNIGTVTGVENTFLPKVVGAFHSRHPDVGVQLTEGRSMPLLAMVRSGGLDAAVICAPLGLPGDVAARTVLQDGVVAVAAYDCELARNPEVTLQELISHPIITYSSDSGLRPVIESAFTEQGLALQVSHACNDVGLQAALAAHHVGIALSAGSDPALHAAEHIAVLPLSPALPFQKILIWRSAVPPNAVLDAFLKVTAPYFIELSADADQFERAEVIRLETVRQSGPVACSAEDRSDPRTGRH